jgi:hypothetical protein
MLPRFVAAIVVCLAIYTLTVSPLSLNSNPLYCTHPEHHISTPEICVGQQLDRKQKADIERLVEKLSDGLESGISRFDRPRQLLV